MVEKDISVYGENDVFTLENIFYDLDKYFIRADAAKDLDKVAVFMKEHPEIKIELRSFTDSRSSSAYNLKLSERRARAAFDYLVRKGVAASRMEANGYGETELVNDCADDVNCTETDHQRNRRTEFKILSVK